MKISCDHVEYRYGANGWGSRLPLLTLHHRPPIFSMDKVIDSRFERVESALAKLINSISLYNPSPSLATDLVSADAELSQGLEQCQFNSPSLKQPTN